MALAVAVLVAAGTPTPASAKPPPTPGGGAGSRAGSCVPLFGEAPPSTLVKRLVRSTPSPAAAGAAGTFDVTFELTSDRPDGVDRVRDCVWADTNGNLTHDAAEPVSRFDAAVTFAAGRAEYTFTVTAAAGDTACGRASRHGLDRPAYDDRSNLLCSVLAPAEPPPTVPDAGRTALLPLSALPLLLIVARRHRRAAAHAPMGSTRKEHR